MTHVYADPDSNRATAKMPSTVGGRPEEFTPSAPVTDVPHARGTDAPAPQAQEAMARDHH
ncbi:MAG: hypothetical protein JNM62_10215 [Flavobacteriales bacterium]|nr:hypothetical protein [Flavobacteriales bacterium]